MPPLRIRNADLKRSAHALNAHHEYEHLAKGTGRGRQAEELRRQGHALAGKGRDDEAHPLFIDAAACFPPDDGSAGAAAAFYDLAESFKRLRRGIRVENLREARRLLLRSLASPARKRDPIRLALTHDCLGQVLRQLAGQERDEGEGSRMLREALTHLVRACEVVQGIGPIGWKPAVEYLNNLGNALKQYGSLDDAIGAFEEGMRYLDALERHPEWLSTHPIEGPFAPNLKLNLGLALVERGATADSDRALGLARKVLLVGDVRLSNRARMLAARALLALGGPERRQAALAELRAVDFWQMEEELQAELVALQVELGDEDAALVVIQDALRRAMRARQTAYADHVADQHAATCQRYAVLEARIHADAGRAVEAFLALENFSALRYHDAVTLYFHQSTDPVVRELVQHRAALSAIAIRLEDLASRSAYLDTDEQKAALDELAAHWQRWLSTFEEGSAQAIGIGRLTTALTEAMRQPSPVAHLRTAAHTCAADTQRIEQMVIQRDPSYSRKAQSWNWDTSATQLEDILREEPGLVLLRLHWSDELLAAAVWLEEGALASRAARLPLPGEASSALGQIVFSGERAGDEAGQSASPADLGTFLSALDLSSVLPDGHHSHLLILPSLLASLVPWAAAGPISATLLDRFDAISYLPMLTPRLMRQAPHPPRQGRLVVTPGSHPPEAPTAFHDVAFSEPSAGEVRLAEASATVEATLAAARGADTVAFYAHGRHGGLEVGALQLADDELWPAEVGRDLIGCERVELWACQSGVNLPTDGLTPFVDEGFGLDIMLHHHGARSTIGTLWKVPDLVTAQIVRQFQRGLRDGLKAPAALAEAQRWWRDQALVRIRQLMEELPEQEALQAILRDLGAPPAELEADPVLGPIRDGKPAARATVEQLVARLAAPDAWAGYRFVGVCERRPSEPWTPDHERPLTVEEQAELARLLAEAPEQGRDIDEVYEEWLEEACALDEDAHPTPEQAVRVARLYAGRRFSCHRHNLLRGLAWLHEALAAPELDAEQRQRLCTEAAWLWLDLARGELVEEGLRLLRPDPVLLTRIQQMLPDVADADVPIIEAWLALLDSAGGDLERRVAVVGAHRERAWTAALQRPRACYEGRRARGWAAALLLMVREPDPALVEPVLSELSAATEGGYVGQGMFLVAELESLAAELGHRIGLRLPPPKASLLSHREIARMLHLASRQAAAGDALDHLQYHDQLIELIALLEADCWGVPADDRTPFWLATGTPGAPWATAVGGYLAAKLRGPHAQDEAIHFIASIQMGSDLRIGALNGWARCFGHQAAGALEGPWWSAWLRHWHLQHLEDAAGLSRIKEPAEPARPSAFNDARGRLIEAGVEGVQGRTQWETGMCLANWWQGGVAARTAAFEVERRLRFADADTRDRWPAFFAGLHEGGPEELRVQPGARRVLENVTALIDPQRVLADCEAWVRNIAEGTVVLGAMVGAAGELMLASAWRRGDRLHQRTWCSEPGRGTQVVLLLSTMVESRPEDLGQPAVEPSRADAWSQLCGALGVGLAAVLAPAVSEPPGFLAVLAPGPLRSLPWLGLDLDGQPLRERFSAAASLPHIGFERTTSMLGPIPASPYTVCSLASDLEDGETRYGEAVVRSLRDQLGVQAVAEPPGQRQGPKIDEVDIIEEHANRLRVLRIYSTRSYLSLNPTTEALVLKADRLYTARNLSNTQLPRCEVVELWASPGGSVEARAILQVDRDVMPALVRSFLCAGASGVLDLAWPVPDLVKALVCEQYGQVRHLHRIPGAMALREALLITGRILAHWRKLSAGFATVRDALASLDEARVTWAAQAGHDPSSVHPLAAVAGHPDAPAAPFVEECCDPVHLATFRWWGA